MDNIGTQEFSGEIPQAPEVAAQMQPVSDEEVSQSEGVGQEGQVPLAALQSERAKRQELEERVKVMSDHMSLMQANAQMYQQQPKAAEEQKPKLSKDDVLTYGEFEELLSARESAYKQNIAELRMAQKYKDYEDVITKYLPEVLKQSPQLRATLQQSQDYELAYYLAKNSDAYKSDSKQTKKNADVERIMRNAEQPGSLSSIGSATARSTAKSFKSMSDDEFRALANKNSGYF